MVRLGRSDIEITPIGLGCWQFASGGGFVGRFWGEVGQPTVDEIVRLALDGGISWFDTAEAYGRGRSEQSLARALKAAHRANGEVVLATKWWPIWRTARSIPATIDERLARLDGYGIDLHQVHQPYSLSSVAAQMNAMADLVEQRKIRSVGVSNFSAARMRAAHAALERRHIPLVSNQVPYSLLHRGIERSGVLAAAKELGITIIAYSPLAQGVLSGRFHDDPSRSQSLPGPRRLMPSFRKHGLERSRPVVEELGRIAAAHGVNRASVALGWVVQRHGDTVVAIPGATKVAQVPDLVAALQLRLKPSELDKLDELSAPWLGR